jgi:hypothetical protein
MGNVNPARLSQEWSGSLSSLHILWGVPGTHCAAIGRHIIRESTMCRTRLMATLERDEPGILRNAKDLLYTIHAVMACRELLSVGSRHPQTPRIVALAHSLAKALPIPPA